jgi:hypothetical protein
MALEITTVDNFPQITRSGRTSAELQQIIDSLVESSNTGKTFAISNVEQGKKFNSLQQRIRAQAKKLELKVTIHFDKNEGKLYYKSPMNDSMKKEVTSKEIKSVKTSDKIK